MAVKNLWSLNPGETIVAEALKDRFKDRIELYFPLKDTGIDLLAVVRNTKKVITFQVKESRYYENGKGSSWHQEHKEKLIRNEKRVDFYVFVIYLPAYLASNTVKKDRFIIHYVIVPIKDLIKKSRYKNANKAGIYSFYFRLDRKNVNDVRESKKTLEKNPDIFNYNKYFNNWDLVKNRIGLSLIS